MCGIAGILSVNPSHLENIRLKKMTDALAHRGPDGEGIWKSPGGYIGLGHRRLSIIDLSPLAAQPMHYQQRYTIVHNGELYNYLELRNLLQTRNYSFATVSDTEVIVAAYDYYGPDCLQYFDGMFAFAIWDEREKKIFLARDRFGEKPLFFYRDGEQFLFASEMKSLWAAGIRKEMNRRLLFNFITVGYTQNPANGSETFYSGICRLPARSWLKYDPISGQTESATYWDIEMKEAPLPVGEEQAINRFRELFTGSIEKRLRSDVRIGASLSGGLDSSSVVAAMYDRLAGKLSAFSAVFPDFERDESAFIQSVGLRYPIESHTVTPGADGLIRDFEKLIYHQEEPFGSSSIYAQFSVYQLAFQCGVKVLLDGQGADELLAGYHKYYHWYWQELYRSDRKAFLFELEAARQSGIHDKWTWKNRLAANLPVYAGMFLKKKKRAQQRRNNNLAPEFVEHFGVSYYDIPRFDKLNGVLYYNTFQYGMEELLRYADRNAMAHGVEVRLPFLNHELVEFLFALPSHYKIRDGWTKWLLRVSMEGVLPKEIAWRRDKTGFEPPQKAWMTSPVLQEYIHEARRSLVNAGVLQASVLQKKIQPQDAHAAENYDWRFLVTAACMTR